jgi:hypothetical protein
MQVGSWAHPVEGFLCLLQVRTGGHMIAIMREPLLMLFLGLRGADLAPGETLHPRD